ncbi:MAG TPA: maltotransferase domain-containing protein, partial [Stellaceae bacterium]|nr:maltotransferase domain-containing protein [Stellaceae bacterium]
MPGSRLYYLHPLFTGPIEAWPPQLDRIAAMAFDAVAIAPPFAAGGTGDLFATADHDRADPRLGGGDAVAFLARFAAAARERGLSPLIDLVLDRVAVEGAGNGLARWYRPEPDDELPDPRRPPHERGVAKLAVDGDAARLVAWWARRLDAWLDAGIAGFRCIAAPGVPSRVWRDLIAAVRRRHPGAVFIAATGAGDGAPGGALAACGFDFAMACLAPWRRPVEAFAETADRLARVAPLIAMPEAPFDRRLARAFGESGRARRAAHRALDFATAVGAGWLMPAGFEFGAAREMDPARDRPEDFARLVAAAPFDLTPEVAAANRRCAVLCEEDGAGELRPVSPPDAPAVAVLLLGDGDNADRPARHRLVVANASLDAPVRVPLAPLLAAGGIAGALLDREADDAPLGPDAAITVDPAEVRLLRTAAGAPIRRAPTSALDAAAAPRIAIEAVAPAVEDGRFAAKRLVGETVEVSADLISDGHERLAAALLWRPADEADWHETPMRLVGNDRWAGSFPLTRLGPYRFTVLAWRDRFASYAEELEKKHAAGLAIDLELEEGRLSVVEAAGLADPAAAPGLRDLADRLASADAAERRRLLLAPSTAAAMTASRVRPHASRHPAEFPVEAERRAAGYASWYELFPRSQSGDPARHGTFDDVIARLPAIAEMGFDVLYLPPIHPIGGTNRKGRDNAARAAPGDPGSPYAIGGAAGGHDAIHPELGTLDDFRRLRHEAARHRIELALDFAVQASPDHPWLREHPDWFQWRPDGSIRYAENPPKKYEDIVNVDFYAPAAVPSLWLALCDVVLFWAGEGVRLFRVDNPHTKPLPFWEWLIAEVRAQYPDAVFLAEAFTHPKLMYRLAKLGFSQSYTYFTWRNTKAELTEYLTELTTEAREFFRPHFFVNTPDINPVFLQASGRPGFLIRAALAATLSGLFGIYSGFELCEARALPGREEYAASEKYEIRAWDWNAPGNIVAEIARLNRIRRANPALQTHLGLGFHNAFNDQVLYYSKATADLQNVVLVAVNLDPHFPQECDIEVPLWFWGLPDSAAVAVTDLLGGH